jgi:hypothetical protein
VFHNASPKVDEASILRDRIYALGQEISPNPPQLDGLYHIYGSLVHQAMVLHAGCATNVDALKEQIEDMETYLQLVDFLTPATTNNSATEAMAADSKADFAATIDASDKTENPVTESQPQAQVEPSKPGVVAVTLEAVSATCNQSPLQQTEQPEDKAVCLLCSNHLLSHVSRMHPHRLLMMQPQWS